MWVRVLIPVVLVFATACGDDDASPSDANTADVVSGPAGPAAPEPPMFGPCPTGWRAVDVGDGLSPCEPWPEGGYAGDACAIDEAHLPGTPGCAPLGRACPADGVPPDLPADAMVLHVSPTAAPGGFGTRTAPLDTIAAAAARAGAGFVIALWSGMHRGGVMLRGGITVEGACIAETLVSFRDPLSPLQGVVFVEGDGVTLRELRIGDSPRAGVWNRTRMGAVVEHAVLHDLAITGVLASRGASVTVRDVAIRNTNPDTTGEFGRGLMVQLDSTLTMRNTSIEDTSGTGIALNGGTTTASIEDVAVVGAGTHEPLALAEWGIALLGEANAEITRTAVEDSVAVGVLAFDGSRASVTDAVVRGTVSRMDPSRVPDGDGVVVADSIVELRRAWVSANTGIGVGASHRSDATTPLDTEVVAEDVIVEDTMMNPLMQAGRGINLQYGVHADLSRVHVRRNRDTGISVLFDASATLSDVTVADTAPDIRNGLFGRGIALQDGAVIDGRRVHVFGAHDVGLYAIESGSAATLEDVTIRSTLARGCAPDCGESGVDVVAYRGAAIDLTGFLVADANLCGVQVAENAGLDLRRGIVSGNPIGACVQIDGYDLARLMEDVVYVDNEINLEATTLPVPEASTVEL